MFLSRIGIDGFKTSINFFKGLEGGQPERLRRHLPLPVLEVRTLGRGRCRRPTSGRRRQPALVRTLGLSQRVLDTLAGKGVRQVSRMLGITADCHSRLTRNYFIENLHRFWFSCSKANFEQVSAPQLFLIKSEMLHAYTSSRDLFGTNH